MKVSRDQMAENRSRILEVASRLFRERGFEAVTVADVMKAAGLTHGGFYGHFKSKDDLFAQAISSVIARIPVPGTDLAAYVKGYLTEKHCKDLAGGCPAAGLAAETIRQCPEARAEMTAGLHRQISRLTPLASGATEAEKRHAAIGSWAAMVGAMILARASDDEAFSKEILAATREWISSGSR